MNIVPWTQAFNLVNRPIVHCLVCGDPMRHVGTDEGVVVLESRSFGIGGPPDHTRVIVECTTCEEAPGVKRALSVPVVL